MLNRALLAGAIAVFCSASLFLSAPAQAEEFETINDRTTFLKMVSGKQLTMLGIKLAVGSDGRISGSAYGKPVRGQWNWTNGYFCRDLYFGERDLGPNCQTVKANGRTLRFIADQGAGMSADLRLN